MRRHWSEYRGTRQHWLEYEARDAIAFNLPRHGITFVRMSYHIMALVDHHGWALVGITESDWHWLKYRGSRQHWSKYRGMGPPCRNTRHVTPLLGISSEGRHCHEYHAHTIITFTYHVWEGIAWDIEPRDGIG
ncbi:hypothetical protein SLA2020_060260 [Shorea laevis]